MNNKLPPFGDLLNAGIQTIKNLSNRNRISQNVFFREFESIAGIHAEHKNIIFMSSEDIRNECEEGTLCYDLFIDLMLLSISAFGLVKENRFSLQPNLDKNFANIIAFDERITPKNLNRIDPFGRIFFWLAQENFSNYINNGVYNNDYIANLERFDNKSYSDLKRANKVAYGNGGDPLINYLIEETTRRTSLFMNNYQDVMVGDGFLNGVALFGSDDGSDLHRFAYFLVQNIQYPFTKLFGNGCASKHSDKMTTTQGENADFLNQITAIFRDRQFIVLGNFNDLGHI